MFYVLHEYYEISVLYYTMQGCFPSSLDNFSGIAQRGFGSSPIHGAPKLQGGCVPRKAVLALRATANKVLCQSKAAVSSLTKEENESKAGDQNSNEV